MAVHHDLAWQVVRDYIAMDKVVGVMRFDADHDSAHDVVACAADWADTQDSVAGSIKDYLDAKGVEYAEDGSGAFACKDADYLNVARGLVEAYMSLGYVVKAIDLSKDNHYDWMNDYLGLKVNAKALSRAAKDYANEVGIDLD